MIMKNSVFLFSVSDFVKLNPVQLIVFFWCEWGLIFMSVLDQCALNKQKQTNKQKQNSFLKNLQVSAF